MEINDHGIRIDAEFRGLISFLTAAELEELESSLKAEGCRDPLILWNFILLDGHNRYEICNRLHIPFTTRSIECADRESAKEWILTNQLARRNLTLYQRSKLVLQREDIVKARAKEKQLSGLKRGNEMPVTKNYSESVDRNTRTADSRLGQMAGTSLQTIGRVREIEKHASPEENDLLAKGEISINKVFKRIQLRKQADGADSKQQKKPRAVRIKQIADLARTGHRASQIAEKLGMAIESIRIIAKEERITLPDAIIGRTRNPDVNIIISETVMAAMSLTAGLNLVDSRLDRLDGSRVDEWINSLRQSIAILNSLVNKIAKRRIDERQNG